MRIDRLDLTAFGPFTNTVLDLSGGAEGLHVVYGPNEAGKSSALRAIRQIFTGIPHVSTDDFVHRYADMRLGALLRDRAGTVLELVRRKKAKNPLGRADETPVSEAELARFLGGVAPEEFVRRFALDRDELVAGGKSVAQEHGDLGRVLFAAGASNLARVGAVLKALDKAAEELFKKGGAKPKINADLGLLEQAKARVKQATLPSADWRAHDEALRAARARKEELDQEVAATSRDRTRLGRVADAIVPIARRKAVRAELDGLGSAPRLSPDFGARRAGAVSLLPKTERDETKALQTIEELTAKLAALNVPTPLLDHAEAIEELHTRLGVHVKNAGDGGRLRAELAQHRNDARLILRDLGHDPDLTDSLDDDAREAFRIKSHDRATVEDLATLRLAVEQAHDSAEKALAKHDAKLRTAVGKREALPPERDPSSLRQALKRAQNAGDLDESLRKLRAELKRKERRAGVDLKTLGLWSGPLDALEAMAVPLPETLDRFAAEWDAAHAEIDDVERRARERQNEARENKERVEQLESAGTVPTADELGEARRQREALWEPLKSRWDDALAASFEQAVKRADEAADRLVSESKRVTDHAVLRHQRTRLARALDELREERDKAETRVEAVRDQWSALWLPLGIDAPGAPKEMLAWSRKHAELVALARSIREQADECRGLEDRIEQHRRDVAGALGALGESSPPDDAPLVDIVERAQAVLDAIAKEAKARDKLKSEVDDRELERPALVEAVTEKRGDWERWQAQWADAMGVIGLPPDVSPAAASAVMSRNVDLFDKLDKAASDRLQIAALAADDDRFKSDAWRLAEHAAPDLAVAKSFDADAVVAALYARLTAARTARQESENLTQRIRELEEAVAAVREDIAAHRATLEALRHEAGCDPEDDLVAVEERSKRREELEKELSDLDTQLQKLAAGADLAAFVSEVEQTDPDALPGRLALLDERLDALDLEKAQVNEKIGGEKIELDRMDGGALAAEQSQEAEELRARVKADVEQYARLRLASAVLRAGIDRYRKRVQGPILARASRLFATLTLGSFADLQVDADDPDKPVLKGVRPGGGTPLGVEAMSVATADQLYFALRLATLESYLDRHEPLPLIVDDVLVQFDDARAAATLRTLAELSRRTQVLFFTHHEHLVRLAEAEVYPAMLFTHILPGRGVERPDPHPPFGHPLPQGEGIRIPPSPTGRGLG